VAGLCLFAATLLSTILSAAEPAATEEIGLRIGQRAPAFTLNDQNGKDVSLDALLKKGPVALVFFRSADWCLYCELQLIQLQRNLKDIDASGGQVVGISYEPPATSKCFADRRTISIPLLADPGSKTIDAYGVRDKKVPRAKDGAASHVTFILDQEGIVRTKLLRVIYNDQSDVDALVKALKDAQRVAGGTKQ
jgi:peroxiredoxin